MPPLHFETNVELNAPAEGVSTYLKNHGRLSMHISRPSRMMARSRMAIELDAFGGRAVGAVIRLRGRVLGIPLCVEKVVSERRLPLRKVWETTGTLNILVMSQYKKGYEITPKGKTSMIQASYGRGRFETLPVKLTAGEESCDMHVGLQHCQTLRNSMF